MIVRCSLSVGAGQHAGPEARLRRDLAAACGGAGGRIRAGQVTLNGASGNMNTPFGGFKMSGNGREYGEFGLRDFLEVKAVIGVDAA